MFFASIQNITSRKNQDETTLKSCSILSLKTLSDIKL